MLDPGTLALLWAALSLVCLGAAALLTWTLA
jgi:hypothetical protein